MEMDIAHFNNVYTYAGQRNALPSLAVSSLYFVQQQSRLITVNAMSADLEQIKMTNWRAGGSKIIDCGQAGVFPRRRDAHRSSW